MTAATLAARVAAPRPAWAGVPAQLLLSGHRRLEARTYLTDGYGIRSRLESLGDKVSAFSTLAEVWQPSRLKGYETRADVGVPYLSAGQVLEARPRIRKWLARGMINDIDRRTVELGWILLTRSGEVGRVTTPYAHHVGPVITDDLLRVVAHEPESFGWLYAYMRTPSFYAMTRSAQYGHMIKHLEPEHVLALPVLTAEPDVRSEIGALAARAVQLRAQALETEQRAFALYGEHLNPDGVEIVSSIAQSVPVTELMSGRRRFEGQTVRAEVRQLSSLVESSATNGTSTLGEVCSRIALGNRFKRHFGPDGTPYRSAGELFDVNAAVTKRIYAGLLDNPERYMLEPGWLIMACSGQTYGLLGRTLVTTEAHAGVFGSHDLIRIEPDLDQVRIGYLQTVLNHPEYGRPLVIRHASGTSVPHLDPVDVRTIRFPRFGSDVEAEIADLMESAIEMFYLADGLETEATERAEALIEQHVGGVQL
ncbi:hypothetical protein QQX13_12175 [Demequina sp. SYSU T00068]|uniref:hypothetical protein n=1 Tax=Demequina lignilytica TaxID=3051663 RepID=UPI00260B9881|nr:hypothetical protein [Demequina sp. SYSU T00068]MDN4491591.1 hypothetical protein [Demequina sp. SYSU T00068]